MSNPLTFPVFFFFLFSFLLLVCSCFLFFSSSFLPARCLPPFFLSFLSFFSRRSVNLFVARLFLFFFLFCFLLLSIPAFFFVLFVDVVLWCLKTVVYGNQVRFESLKNSAGTSTKSDKCYIVIYTFMQHHNDTTIKTQEGKRTKKGRTQKDARGRHRKKRRRIKTQEDFFSNIFTSDFIARVRKGCWRVACERMLETEHKLHILTPLSWPSRCVFLVLLDAQPEVLGSTPSGLFRGPPRSGVAFPPTSGLYCLEVYWQLLWDPNSTELNNNSTPTRSPTGSLKSNV